MPDDTVLSSRRRKTPQLPLGSLLTNEYGEVIQVVSTQPYAVKLVSPPHGCSDGGCTWNRNQ